MSVQMDGKGGRIRTRDEFDESKFDHSKFHDSRIEDERLFIESIVASMRPATSKCAGAAQAIHAGRARWVNPRETNQCANSFQVWWWLRPWR